MATAVLEQSQKIVEKYLEGGPWESSKLEKLSGGTCNFIYRGTLKTPLSNGTKSVIIKHTPQFVASIPSFKLSDDRGGFEAEMLIALESFPPVGYAGVTIDTPRLQEPTIDEHQIGIYTDLRDSTDLKSLTLTRTLTKEQSEQIGRALSCWMKTFHQWARDERQLELVESLKGNIKMRDMKIGLNYTRLLAVVVDKDKEYEWGSTFTQDDCKKFVEVNTDIVNRLKAGEGQLILRDFWPGNVLLTKALDSNALDIYVVDWEFAQFSLPAFDIGQMFAELYMLDQYKSISAGVWPITGFMEGYGDIEKDLAYQVAIHAGAHIIVWGNRTPGHVNPLRLWHLEGEIKKRNVVTKSGKDWILKGWAKDENFFKSSVLSEWFK